MSIKNTKWIKKNNKKQNEWIYHYLIKNCSKNPRHLNVESVGVFVSDGELITDEERSRMESAWRSYSSRQNKKNRNISISKEAYQLVSTMAKRNKQPVGQYIESLIYDHPRCLISTQQPARQQPKSRDSKPYDRRQQSRSHCRKVHSLVDI